MLVKKSRRFPVSSRRRRFRRGITSLYLGYEIQIINNAYYYFKYEAVIKPTTVQTRLYVGNELVIYDPTSYRTRFGALSQAKYSIRRWRSPLLR